jgi:serine/threonine protein kinase
MKTGEKLAGRYLVVKTLGAGGFGKTYLAQDTQRPGQPLCVVKHLKPDSNDEFVLTTARRLFTSEAEILEKLGKHDQIPALLAYFEENGQFYLAQEFIEGHPLSQEIKRGVPWPQDKVVRMLADVLGTLDFVHQNGVIHRDIKPDNLIRRKSDGKLVLIDFGAVKEIQDPKAAAQQRTGATVAIGTVGYAPAEQAQGKPQFASDIYSLGIVAICALTGKEPDQLESDPQTGELVWRQGITVSHALGTVLDRMVRYQYSRRYAHAGEALAALRSFSLIGTTAVGTPSATASTSKVTATPKTQIRRAPTTTLVSSSGVDGVVWKYGIITVIALVIMGILSIPLQSILNQRVSQVRSTPTTSASETQADTQTPVPVGDKEYDVPDELFTAGSWRTENIIRGEQRHIYRILSNITEIKLSWRVETPNVVAALFDPYDNLLESAAQRGSKTLRREDTPYRLVIGGQPGRYGLSLRVSRVEPSPTPTPEKEEEEPPRVPDNTIEPRLPGR